MNEQILSDEELNAFVDKQLSAADQARVLEAIRHDPALQRRVAEYEQTRHLLRHGYLRPPAPAAAALPTPRHMKQALAASVLLALGLGVGSQLHNWRPASFTSAKAQPKGVVIQVSENDPAKWELALINARNVRKAYGDKPVGVEIVAYGPGLKMFRDNSPVAADLEAAQKDGVKLLACGNTMRMTQTTREQLNRAVDIVPAGIVEIMERQQDGYAYVRP